MIRHVFLSLPVADLDRAKAFFAALGLGFDPRFGGADGACVLLNERIAVMLLPRATFERYAHKPVPDPMTTTQHLIAITLDSREAVDDLHDRAVAAGAASSNERDDYGFMYQRGFHDPDGHPWALTWMDPSRMPAGSA
ncbi:VOC family protein [Cognatilysobacter segetis]|uniref:VOC family protein n=1 Tax=Cognatilysobacter segetis TaxID=2492394 RepID=UPI00105F6F50|nr:VOC family protein [Lysobacter segetis]